MKQTIPFEKDIKFDDSIAEITSISLDQELALSNNDSIVGEFIVSGKYKKNKISITTDSFEERLPIDITLDDKYDASVVTIDIDNFYYEIINNDTLRLNIDVLVDNLVCIKKDERKIDEEIISDDIEVIGSEPEKEEQSEIFEPINDVITSNDNYCTYKIHIIRNNETIDDIATKYEITKDKLMEYNDISNVVLGSKIIIPFNE